MSSNETLENYLAVYFLRNSCANCAHTKSVFGHSLSQLHYYYSYDIDLSVRKLLTARLARIGFHKEVVISGSVIKDVIERRPSVSSFKMQPMTEKADNSTGPPANFSEKGIDTEKHKIERCLCGPNPQQNPRESGVDRNGDDFVLPEANGKSKCASKLTDNACHKVESQGCSFLVVDGPWHDVPLSSDDEKGDSPYTTKMNTKDSEAEKQMARDWYDVSHGDENTRIEDDYINLGSEYGSGVSDDWDERTEHVGSRDSRPKKVRQ
ncbi:uncharacterized protein TRIVIDRAFT_222603 [Trichoderma virens Gv29-8]|uniref:Uncharacterized protein n=1 Tax=Hypocrea virens (strain Gv29-8 / FGSC 10586) TaxID=413071 RepID=G9MUE0_HYPVG|nr:uncharacterized protein TRIVIDRAFT_222603 [Trichoderma virens Gv29-8]EHK21933.1 hypothetical protein TRIVIDRAFT_222603 [Trichoderma virens Gv29-8]UKZ52465.1 hypothetical protein TrVGV298_006242 [Trichoderma virens]